jgi:hypothetical protein
MPIFEGFQSLPIEAVDALAHGLALKADPSRNRRCALAATGAPDELDALGRSRMGLCQALDGRELVSS